MIQYKLGFVKVLYVPLLKLKKLKKFKKQKMEKLEVFWSKMCFFIGLSNFFYSCMVKTDPKQCVLGI